MHAWIRSVIAALALLILSAAAHAIPVRWTVTNLSFTDGSTASGSFVYNADTGVVSDISITTTTSGVGPFVVSGPLSLPPNPLQFVEAPVADGAHFLYIGGFASPLTNAGGTVALQSPLYIQVCASTPGSVCNTAAPNSTVRALEGATLVGEPILPAAAAVPTLNEWTLLLTGLLAAGLGAHFFKRRAQA